MIVGTKFQGDSTRIAKIQHDCYGEALRVIFNFSVQKHREAERVVAVRTELSDLRDEPRACHQLSQTTQETR